MVAVNTFLFLIALSTSGQVYVLEGDEVLVSRIDGGLGLRFDPEENDLAEVVRRTVETISDVNGTLVLFTTFEDIGRGGRAYSVAIFNDTAGTGQEMIDRRAELGGGAKFVQLVNMKTVAGHREGELQTTLAHELAHRHLAYMPTTSTIAIVGRQEAHWHAALQTDGSIMGGYGWSEIQSGVFEVSASAERFSSLDLYGLGLLPASEVAPFFFIDGLRTEEGFLLPEAAALSLGERALGRRRDLSINDVIAAIGPRELDPQPINALFILLTAPGETATATSIAAIEKIRAEAEENWRALTLGRGELCTTIKGCTPPRIDPEGCSCKHTRERSPAVVAALLLPLLLLLRSARISKARTRPQRRRYIQHRDEQTGRRTPHRDHRAARRERVFCSNERARRHETRTEPIPRLSVLWHRGGERPT